MTTKHKRFNAGNTPDGVVAEYAREEADSSATGSRRTMQMSEPDSNDDESDAPQSISKSTARKTLKRRDQDVQEARAAKKHKSRPSIAAGDLSSSSSTTASNKLDPRLFAQASTAVADMQKSVKKREAVASMRKGVAPKHQFTRQEDVIINERRVFSSTGSTTLEQLYDPPSKGAGTIVNKVTAMPSISSQKFLNTRLYKPRRSPKSAQPSTKSKQPPSLPATLFDPLLDGKKRDYKLRTNRRIAEVERRNRGRQQATTAYTKAQINSITPGCILGFTS